MSKAYLNCINSKVQKSWISQQHGLCFALFHELHIALEIPKLTSANEGRGCTHTGQWDLCNSTQCPLCGVFYACIWCPYLYEKKKRTLRLFSSTRCPACMYLAIFAMLYRVDETEYRHSSLQHCFIFSSLVSQEPTHKKQGEETKFCLYP